MTLETTTSATHSSPGVDDAVSAITAQITKMSLLMRLGKKIEEPCETSPSACLGAIELNSM